MGSVLSSDWEGVGEMEGNRASAFGAAFIGGENCIGMLLSCVQVHDRASRSNKKKKGIRIAWFEALPYLSRNEAEDTTERRILVAKYT